MRLFSQSAIHLQDGQTIPQNLSLLIRICSAE